MKRIAMVAAVGFAATLHMVGQTVNSKSSTGNIVIQSQTGALQRYTFDGRLLNTIATVPGGLAVTKDSGIYWVVTGSSLVKVTPTGVANTFSGAPTNSQWAAIAPDHLGNLIVADNRQHSVWLINPAANTAKQVANYPVNSNFQSEDVAVAVDPSSGNYLVVEDSGGSLNMFSISPSGVVNPVSLTFTGAAATHCTATLIPYLGGYVFLSPAQNAVFEITTGVSGTVITELAGNFTTGGSATSATINPDSGDLYVDLSGGLLLDIAANSTCSPNCPGIGQFTSVPPAMNMISETWADLPHVAAGSTWTSGFYVFNTGLAPASYSVSFFDNSGNPLALPFPAGSSSVLQGTLPAQGMTYVEAANPQGALLQGSGLVSADATITVQALFRNSAGGNYYEAAVPAVLGGTGFAMPFDFTTFAATGAQIYTGIAIGNLDPVNAATVNCVTTSQAGSANSSAVQIPVLPAMGHFASFQFTPLYGSSGTLSCSSTTRIAAIGIRNIGSAFSTLTVVY